MKNLHPEHKRPIQEAYAKGLMTLVIKNMRAEVFNKISINNKVYWWGISNNYKIINPKKYL